MVLVVKNPLGNAGDTRDVASIPSISMAPDPLKESMATHSSVLAWRIPQIEEPDGLQFIGLQRVRHD